ncbi:chemotaxis protein CheA [Candidatus Dependentiae bacterium]|nr:chemotaxis protein CheA [Candidatus Dependentiae bacterium]
MDLSKYLDVFLSEATENLQEINNNLVYLEDNPNDSVVFENIFRAMHTLKGMSATMEFDIIAELAHKLEDLLDDIRRGNLKFSLEIFEILFEGMDMMTMMIQNISQGEKEGVEIKDIINKVKEFRAATPSATPPKQAQPVTQPQNQKAIPIPESEQIPPSDAFSLNSYELNLLNQGSASGFTPILLTVNLEETCMLKSVRAYMVFQKLEEMGDIIKSIPRVDEIEEEKFDLSFSLLMLSHKDPQLIQSFIKEIREIDSVDLVKLDLDEPVEESLPMKSEVVPSKPELVITPKGTKGKLSKGKKQVETLLRTQAIQNVRVNIEQLDDMVNLVGELVINKIQLQDQARRYNLKELDDTIVQLSRIATNLQQLIMTARMVPVGQIFDRFPRMVRDLAKDAKKDISFNITGRDIELDRTILDEIGKPLVHLLRNAVDHGIETKEARKKSGKSKVAKIDLIARREKNQVIIEVIDDGKGMSSEKIKAEGIKRGIITKDTGKELTKEEIFSLICEPGFSTAKKVTDISGRGVGMDVVRNKIESLSGILQIESEVGKGSTFKLKLPLTLAIIQALLVRLKDEIYLLPMVNIKETSEIYIKDIQTIKNKETVLLKGKEILPIIRMNRVLNIDSKMKDDDLKPIVVVEIGEKKAGIVFDELLGQQEIVIKALDKLLQKIRTFSGVAILANGNPALILDIQGIL